MDLNTPRLEILSTNVTKITLPMLNLITNIKIKDKTLIENHPKYNSIGLNTKSLFSFS